MIRYSFFATFFSLLIFLSCSSKKNDIIYINIAEVPSSFPVNFELYTTDEYQFIAFYDTSHTMTIASRLLKNNKWTFKQLDSKVGWDSHNYLSLIVDSLGYIHLVGNMHSSPLIYYKSSEPFDINSMQPVNMMIGTEEDVTTYPAFILSPKNEIIFHYRYGRSGNGYEIYNNLNVAHQTWERLLDTPLIDGKGEMNAYIQGPVIGPDGFYHIIWVWRDTPDCSTNHDLSYARSRDLIHWESIKGELVNLPLVMDYKELLVDKAKAGEGLINIGIKIGFDKNKNVLIGYHKYDGYGNTQLFIARYTNNDWQRQQITDWDYRWDFKGMGTIENELLIESPYAKIGTDKILFGFHHVKYGEGQIVVDEKSLSYIKTEKFEIPYPKELDEVESDFTGMLVNKVYDSGPGIIGKKYMLRWETLPPNRDEAREGIFPSPSLLQLVEILEN